MHELNLDVPWSIGEKAFEGICNELEFNNPKKIFEFGSGVSSIRFAQQFPLAQIYCLDHEQRFAKRTQKLALLHNINPNRFFIESMPLKWQRYGITWYLTYAVSNFPQDIDVVIIDGPPARTRRGREACLYQIERSLRIGGVVFLDDLYRIDEHRIAQNWMMRYGDYFDYSVIRRGHGLLKMTKRKNSGRFSSPITVIADNFIINLIQFYIKPIAKSFLKPFIC